jgi:hypothetical protein
LGFWCAGPWAEAKIIEDLTVLKKAITIAMLAYRKGILPYSLIQAIT